MVLRPGARSVPSGHLPRFAGEEMPAATPILPRLRGRGTMRSMVEGAHP